MLALSIALADRMRFKDALEVLDSAERQFPDRVRTATTLARLAASPDRSLRDGQRLPALATRVYEKERSPAHGETMALALAELGRCAEAASWMQRAVARRRSRRRHGDRRAPCARRADRRRCPGADYAA